MCDCADGMPAAAATPAHAAALARNAKALWELHQRQEQLFAPPPGPTEVDIVLPRLLHARRRVPCAQAGANALRAALQYVLFVLQLLYGATQRILHAC